eukprot:gnl/TRDRNA2_/TRDRNA2_29455_c0_seq1.p1 gnl/TRDRNA2_/TRDRNA2_29455_c0~~gnl/TRDRNA2_/TRDRNA2_29455_c0_seq1.p1  ORF type:complete len:493 (+),score=83.79 gnl/TRDRNA2_/TRDRNA2_29455_c0_seq1:63-1481(+)
MAASAAAALRSVPGPPASPLLGQTVAFAKGVVEGLKVKKPYGFLRQWHNDYGPLVKIDTVMMRNTVSVADAQIVKYITRNDPARFTKGSTYSVVKRGWLDDSLVVSEGETWRRKRSVYTRAFKIGAIRSYVPVFSEIADATAESWRAHHEKQQSVDAVAGFQSLALEAIGRAGFGTDGIGKPGNKFAVSFMKYLDTLNTEVTSLPMILSPESLRQAITRMRGSGYLEDMTSESRRIVHEASASKQEEGSARQNLVALMQQAAAEEGMDLDPEQLAREANLFLFAGHDTTSATLAWAWACLASHPEVQQKVREEVAAIPEESLLDELSDPRTFPYLGAVIKETLRLYPPAPMVVRRNKEEEELAGCRIAAGTDFLMSIWVLHRDPIAFPDADTFRPDRWIEADSTETKLMNDHWVPFMVGARSCIGLQFSMMEMRVALAKLLRQFSVELDSEPQLVQRMLLLPENIMLKCKPL